ncbi:hypothetical protein C8R47DRAFT_1235666 [Mycena vitilis]|nr:hypothetical protein C8R47DRAFT_1235666 [Mycena vitilis]
MEMLCSPPVGGPVQINARLSRITSPDLRRLSNSSGSEVRGRSPAEYEIQSSIALKKQGQEPGRGAWRAPAFHTPLRRYYGQENRYWYFLRSSAPLRQVRVDKPTSSSVVHGTPAFLEGPRSLSKMGKPGSIPGVRNPEGVEPHFFVRVSPQDAKNHNDITKQFLEGKALSWQGGLPLPQPVQVLGFRVWSASCDGEMSSPSRGASSGTMNGRGFGQIQSQSRDFLEEGTRSAGQKYDTPNLILNIFKYD